MVKTIDLTQEPERDPPEKTVAERVARLRNRLRASRPSNADAAHIHAVLYGILDLLADEL